MIDYYEPQLDLTLLGCGFLGGYHLGAIYLLSQIWPKRPFKRICGSSCGGLIAALVSVGIKLELVFQQLKMVPIFFQRRKAKNNSTNEGQQFKDTRSFLEAQLEKILPEEAHLICEKKCGISLTQLWPFKNKFVCKFKTRRELIDAILSNIFIPFFMGWQFPRYRNKLAMDGFYTNNAPKFNDNLNNSNQIRLQISPFASPEVDVAPRDLNCLSLGAYNLLGTVYQANWRNMLRAFYAMGVFPVDHSKSFERGFHHMKRYLLLEKGIQLIKCQQCNFQNFSNTSSCLSCLKLLERIHSLRINKIEFS